MLKKITNSPKTEQYLIYILCLVILFVLVFNIFNYDPIEGYDATAHFAYVDVLPHLDNLLPENTYEYFNPPLPYIFPSLVGIVCKNFLDKSYDACKNIYIDSIQILQFFMFLTSVYFYLKTLNLFNPGNNSLKLSFLILLFLLTANYKAFAMFRGETYIILLNSILLYRFSRLIKNSFKWNNNDYLIFGIIIGLLALSRQWAFLLFPPYFLLYLFLKNENKTSYLNFIIYSFFVGFAISSWWYFRLLFEFGSFTAFNLETTKFSLLNQKLSFYFPFNSDAVFVFTKPIRSNFVNQFLPIIYSDLWGDYWGYFSFTSNKLDIGRNQSQIGNYLARVNIVSLVPTFILCAGVNYGFKAMKNKVKSEYDTFNTLVFLSILSSFIGYLWFLIKYPSYNGNTIKAVYILQLFHLMCFLGASYLSKVKNFNNSRYLVLIGILTLVFFHNVPAMLSHYQ